MNETRKAIDESAEVIKQRALKVSNCYPGFHRVTFEGLFLSGSDLDYLEKKAQVRVRHARTNYDGGMTFEVFHQPTPCLITSER